MRVLWIDADENPWVDANGWRVLEEFGVDVRRLSSISAITPEVLNLADVFVARVECAGVLAFLPTARKMLQGERKLIVASSVWTKDDFRTHAKTPGAGHRYARVPMPPEGFLGLLADIFGLTVSDLKDFTVAEAETVAVAATEELPVFPTSSAQGDDIDVLRKYLRIKEEQLEISESERQELALENERVQKDAHVLQSRLRELEHLHDELVKKIQVMELEREELERTHFSEKEDLSRQEKQQSEKVKTLEQQVNEANEKYENLRVRVRKDIRKIRTNERDLEARLELLRKDSSTLLSARDDRVLDLQRKIDALEFDLDQVQDGRVQAQMEAERYLAKLTRVARALHIAVGMIEEDHGEEALKELEPMVGGAAMAEEIQEPSPSGDGGSSDSGSSGGDASGNGSGGEQVEPSGTDEAPPAEQAGGLDVVSDELLAADLEALANDGESTQMISTLDMTEGEPKSSSG